ncbi:hypothetical protein ACE5IS_10000 [Leptospira wolffii]|uniref:PIN domain-containing protein n=1 Tax=Leptospira wolffii TaxID=409998 RepID=A0ABV5BN22_9LEPT|nr:hypothetical protein [Leptospira wolffii]TGL52518.1 hypothetical protein EHQ61_05465 [Leptospira wolffii]
MKLLLSSESFKELILGSPSSRRIVSNAIETFTKKNHLFVLALPSLDEILSREKDSVKREIIWNQCRTLFVDLLPIRKEETVLALRLSVSPTLSWDQWTQIALASLADLDGILCFDKSWKGQDMVKILLAQEIDLGGIA